MSNRRDFLKKAAVTAPGIALMGSVQEIPGKDTLPDTAIIITQHDNGWLNARDCGASGSTFQTSAATTSGSGQITVANVGDFKVGQGAMMVSKVQHTL